MTNNVIKNKAANYASKIYDEAHLDNMNLFYIIENAFIDGAKFTKNYVGSTPT